MQNARLDPLSPLDLIVEDEQVATGEDAKFNISSSVHKKNFGSQLMSYKSALDAKQATQQSQIQSEHHQFESKYGRDSDKRQHKRSIQVEI